MKQEDEDVTVEQATARARGGTHKSRVLFVPNKNGDIPMFIMNQRITAENTTM